MPADSPLTGIRTLDSLLDRLPDGAGGRAVARALGAWTVSAHGRDTNYPYPANLSDAGDDELADAYGLWADRYAAMSEVVGLLEGQKALASLASKQARAAARAAVRRRTDDEGKPLKLTAGAIDDEVTCVPSVLDASESETVVEAALASARAYKDGANAIMSSLSRVISLRQAQYAARLRG